MRNFASALSVLMLTACGSSEPTIEERVEGVLEATIECSWLSEYNGQQNDPRSVIMKSRDFGLIQSGEAEWDGAKYYFPTTDLEVYGFTVDKITGWSRKPYGGNDIFWRPGSGKLPPTFLELHFEASIDDVEEEFTRLRDPGENAAIMTIRPIQITSVSSNLTSVRCRHCPVPDHRCERKTVRNRW